MKVFASTDIGKAREMNQDSYFVPSTDNELNLYILADGMGGYTGGEIASELSIQSAMQYIQDNWNKIEKHEKNILELLKDATHYANQKVYEKANQVKELEEMGTTLEICLIHEDKIYISHIGDSRIYLINEDNIVQITKDHSYVEKLVEDGTITREQAKNHPKKHMLIRALGCNEFVEPDLIVRTWGKDELILICSDGLTNMLEDEEIKDVVENEPICPEKALIKSANDAGGIDNITVIIIKH